MRRLLPLLLLAAPVLCWAGAGADNDTDEDPAAPKRGACVYTRPSAATAVDTAPPSPARPVAPAATPRTAQKPVAAGGGGNDAEVVAPRARSTRWHSFLPGMFR